MAFLIRLLRSLFVRPSIVEIDDHDPHAIDRLADDGCPHID